MTLAWRLALRDLRAGGRGLWLLALCLFLGTASLAGIGSLSSSILGALASQSHVMLGGDLEMRVSQRLATVEESATFASAGKLSETVRMRAMAQPMRQGAPILVTLKAVDNAWPLVGNFTLAPGATALRAHGLQAAIAPALADRMGLRIGDALRIGTARLTVIGLIGNEPDKLGEGFNLGPTVLVDSAGLDATGLVQPGSLYEARYRLLLPHGTDPGVVGAAFLRRFPSAGWSVHTPDAAAGMLREGIAQLGQFLLLVGLAALAISGVGVGSGVSAYLGGKTRIIAMLKVLGARSGTIATIFLTQVALVAGGGIVAGLALGAAVPWFVVLTVGDLLPVPLELGVYPKPLLVAVGLGFLVTLLFALPALARARSVPAATLLRDTLTPVKRPSAVVLAGMATLLAALIALAVLTASDRMIALYFTGATGALLVLLWLVGIALRATLRRLRKPRRPLLRMALANLYRPGAPTDRLVVALGLGFSLFVALAIIDTSLSAEMHGAAPARAPRFFAIDLQPEDAASFRTAVLRAAPGATIEAVPSLRGAIVALKGRRVADLKSLPASAWILKGDRTITWSATLPPRNSVTAGHWWPTNYHGPPLVSLEDKAAQELRLRVGDMITVSVLGVEIPARIAVLRKVDWGGLGLNFALVFSPGYIEEAPHGLLASVYAPPDRDGAIARAVAEALPSVSMIRTGDLIENIASVLGQVGVAIRAAAGVTVAAGIVVLIGAVTASGQARRTDIAILKLLGASRVQVLLGQAIEYTLLAGLLSAVALAVGGISGWAVVTQIFALPWTPDWSVVAVTLAVSIAGTLGIGVAASLPALSTRPARMLREG